LDIDIASSW